MKYVMKRVVPRDARGNLVYPSPLFARGDNGTLFEISQVPIYFYMPVPVTTESEQHDGEGEEREDVEGRVQQGVLKERQDVEGP